MGVIFSFFALINVFFAKITPSENKTHTVKSLYFVGAQFSWKESATNLHPHQIMMLSKENLPIKIEHTTVYLPFSTINLDVDCVNCDINCIVYPKHC